MPKRIVQKVMSDEKCQHFGSEKMDAQVIAGPAGRRKLNQSGEENELSLWQTRRPGKSWLPTWWKEEGFGKEGCCLVFVNLTQTWVTSKEGIWWRIVFIRLTCGDSCRAQPTLGSTTPQQMVLDYIKQQVDQASKHVFLCLCFSSCLQAPSLTSFMMDSNLWREINPFLCRKVLVMAFIIATESILGHLGNCLKERETVQEFTYLVQPRKKQA